MSIEVKESKIDKVMRMARKALALAGNNPNAEEAQTALLKAQEILAKHGLSMGDIDVNDIPNGYVKEVVNEAIYEDKAISWWVDKLAVVIADNFRCNSSIWTTRIGGKKVGSQKLRFVGLKEDVELATEVFQQAIYMIVFHANMYVANNGIKGKSEIARTKNDYMQGFIRGLEAKFKEQVERNNWGLVLVQDALVVQAVKGLNLKTAKPKSISFGGADGARAEGYRDGKSFNDRKRIGE